MKVKFKCPFCKQDYELDGEQVLEYRHQTMECAACDKKFLLAETIPCLGHTHGRGYDANGLVAVLEIDKAIAELQKDIEQIQEQIKAGPTQEEIDDRYYGTMDKETLKDWKEDKTFDINEIKEEISSLRDELKDAKEEYNNAKGDLPTKNEAQEQLFCYIGEAYYDGALTMPPNADDFQKLVRIIKNGNDYSDGFELMLKKYGMDYYLKNPNP